MRKAHSFRCGIKAPSMLLTILDNKLKYEGLKLLKIDTFKVKANQYNHVEDSFIKKKSSKRWNIFDINDKEVKIQRDLYSAFIIQNVIGKKLDMVDRDSMINGFDGFKKMHDKEIDGIENGGSRLISSMGI